MTADPYTGPIGAAGRHTGGEPFRIVPAAPPAATGPGLTVAERRTVAMADARDLRPGDELRHESVVGSVLRARIERLTTVHGHPAVVPAVTGTAYATGTSRFTVDPDATLVPGFVLR